MGNGPLFSNGIRTKKKGLAHYVPRHSQDKWIVIDLSASERAKIPGSGYATYVAATAGRSGPFMVTCPTGASGTWQPITGAYSATAGMAALGVVTPAATASAIVNIQTPNAGSTTAAFNTFPMQQGYRILFEAEILPLASTIEGIQQIGFINTAGSTTSRGLFAHKATAAHSWTVYMADGTSNVALGTYVGTAGTLFKIGAIWYGNNYAEAFANNASLGRVDVSSLSLSIFGSAVTTNSVGPIIRTLDGGAGQNSVLFHRDILWAAEQPYTTS